MKDATKEEEKDAEGCWEVKASVMDTDEGSYQGGSTDERERNHQEEEEGGRRRQVILVKEEKQK